MDILSGVCGMVIVFYSQTVNAAATAQDNQIITLQSARNAASTKCFVKVIVRRVRVKNARYASIEVGSKPSSLNCIL